MNKHFFILNGVASSGKDEFKICLNKIVPTYSISSVDKVKKACSILGWDGKKDENGRLALSEFKDLAVKHFNHSYKYIENELKYFLEETNPFVIFTVDVREPKEIELLKNCFNFKTILIIRDSISHIPNNNSDRNVKNFNYDYVIYNNGTIEDLYGKVKDFVYNLE